MKSPFFLLKMIYDKAMFGNIDFATITEEEKHR